jgi:hypothetical protein
LAEQLVDFAPAQIDDEVDDCSHHWMIDTPNGESSSASCKHCGKSRAFLNYSQRKVLTRSVKPQPSAAQKLSV